MVGIALAAAAALMARPASNPAVASAFENMLPYLRTRVELCNDVWIELKQD